MKHRDRYKGVIKESKLVDSPVLRCRLLHSNLEIFMDLVQEFKGVQVDDFFPITEEMFSLFIEDKVDIIGLITYVIVSKYDNERIYEIILRNIEEASKLTRSEEISEKYPNYIYEMVNMVIGYTKYNNGEDDFENLEELEEFSQIVRLLSTDSIHTGIPQFIYNRHYKSMYKACIEAYLEMFYLALSVEKENSKKIAKLESKNKSLEENLNLLRKELQEKEYIVEEKNSKKIADEKLSQEVLKLKSRNVSLETSITRLNRTLENSEFLVKDLEAKLELAERRAKLAETSLPIETVSIEESILESKRLLQSKRVVLFGGDISWSRDVSSLLENENIRVIAFPKTTHNFKYNNQDNDLIIFNIIYASHSFEYRLKSQIKPGQKIINISSKSVKGFIQGLPNTIRKGEEDLNC